MGPVHQRVQDELSARSSILPGLLVWPFAPLLVVLCGALGCEARERSRVTAVSSSSEWMVPSPRDTGDLCLNVGFARACWSAPATGPDCAFETCSIPRVDLARPTPRGTWRCSGRGDRYACRLRYDVGPFECDGDRCVQKHHRLPGDGEWECLDDSGAVVCLGSTEAAGVSPAKPTPGFVCGPRRSGKPGERVCVDFDSDVPEGSAQAGGTTPWVCAFEYFKAPRRECVKKRDARRLGDSCSEAAQCPNGSQCVAGKCLPPRPTPECWLDADCGGDDSCRFGSCARASR
jgi:hypothetical protein